MSGVTFKTQGQPSLAERQAWVGWLHRQQIDRDVSLREIARALGVHHQTVGGWSTGRAFPNPDQRAAVEKLLGGRP